MRTLTAVEFLTVDGVMQGLGSPDEDTEGGFTHGGWGTRFTEGIDPSDSLGATSAYLFGRKTYEKMAAFWPSTARHQSDRRAHERDSKVRRNAHAHLTRLGRCRGARR